MTAALVRLFRPRLALLNGVAALGGCFLFSAGTGAGLLATVFSGVVLLAAAGSALNQVLERDLDRLMARTRLRPLPQGDLTPFAASTVGAAAALAGLALLAAVGGLLPAALGGAALAWYLGVYTPLKRHTSFAPVVGALCGAVTPLIGWNAAGGDPRDFRVVLLAGLLYLWQIPHFRLFQRRHIEDYRGAGLPLPGASLEHRGSCACLLPWLMALAAAAMLLPAFGLIGPRLASWFALVPLVPVVMALCRADAALFSYLNLFPLLVTLAILLERQSIFC
jgi:protoheme IX farnesyltransferase